MDLAVKNREVVGKKVKALRKQGLVPAELYGHGTKNAHLTVPAKDFNKVFKEAGSSTVVTLVTEQGKKPAIIHDIVRDPLTNDIMHIDFYEVRMDEKITAKVPVEFTGDAPAVKEKGAVINKSISEIEVEAFPQDLPHSIVVDISSLDDFNKSIYIKDIMPPKGVAFLIEGDMAIVSAVEPAPEEVAAPVAPVDVSQIASETDEKKAERIAQKPAEE